jgi:hypothetical protein
MCDVWMTAPIWRPGFPTWGSHELSGWQSAVLRKDGYLPSVTDFWRLAAVSRTRRKAPALKLTLDSSEPLEHAMRVLGALYGVTLVPSPDEEDASKPARENGSKPASSKSTARRKSSAARQGRPVAPATDAGADAVQSKQETAPRSAGSPSNAEVRSWARQNGLTVSDRGRVPASVLTAYRNAQDV